MRLALYLLIAIGLVDTQSVTLSSILKSVHYELSHRTILLLQDSEVCWSPNEFQNDLPILIFNGNQRVYLKHKFSAKILALVCLEGSESDVMKALYSNLKDIRDTPTILFAISDSQIYTTFRDCLSKKMLNVVAFKGSDRGIIYSYRAFPTFQIIQRNVSGTRRFFEPQLKDLGGYVLKALPDNIIPRTVVYRDRNGNRQCKGYLSPFIRNYASTINASVQIAWDLVPEEGMIHLKKLMELSHDNDVDIPLAIFGLEIQDPKLGVPMQISSWFLILPMEPAIPRHCFFPNFGAEGMIPVGVLITIVLIVANRVENRFSASCQGIQMGSQVFRGVLAQPFILPRSLSLRLMFIYCILITSGYFMSNFYTAKLATWLVHPPAGSKIHSWEQMQKLNLKILIVPTEFDYIKDILGEEFIDDHRDLFKVTDSVDFQARRLAMDQSYAYPVTGTLWPLLQQAQVRLQRPIFRQSREMVFTPFMLMGMPLPENSIFKKSLSHFATRSHESGLYYLWFSRSFNELKSIGSMSYKVDMGTQSYFDLKWQDYYFIWLGYLGGTCVGLVAFILELGNHRWHRGKEGV
ncbi:hypothetical protein KR009_003517, partial [Drosophila setifemur]